MGSTIGSALQTIGQTGNEVASGDIANQQQQHQFQMDYLARQNASRALDLEQSGQANQLKIAQGTQDIEKQRLAQSRWQLLPGYQEVPDPGGDPDKTVWRSTFIDPITNQRTTYDSPTPPPDSAAYKFRQYGAIKSSMQKYGLNMPASEMLRMAFGQAPSNEQEQTQGFMNMWDTLGSNPTDLAQRNKMFPGGVVDFVTKMKRGVPGETLDMYKQNVQNGLTETGNNRTMNQYDKAHFETLNTSLKVWNDAKTKAMETLQKYGAVGEYTTPEAYAAAQTSYNTADERVSAIQSQIEGINSRYNAQQPQAPAGPPPNPGGVNMTNPVTPLPAFKISKADIQKEADAHKVPYATAEAEAVAHGATVVP